MKLRQRYVVVIGTLILTAVMLNLVVVYVGQQFGFGSSQSARDILQRWKVVDAEAKPSGLQLQPNKFVRQLTVEEFRQNSAYKTGRYPKVFWSIKTENVICFSSSRVSVPVVQLQDSVRSNCARASL